MTNPVDAAIAAAAARSQEIATQSTNPAQQAVSSYQPQARRSAIQAAAEDTSGGVEGYVKMKPSGFIIGGKDKLKSVIVRTNVSDWGATHEGGAFNVTGADGNPRYFRTYDGVVEKSTGRPWADVVLEMTEKFGADKVRPSTSYDVVLELTEAVGDLKAGSLIGFSTTYTANRKIIRFISKANEAGAINLKVEFELTHVMESNSKAQEWASFEFGDFVVVG